MLAMDQPNWTARLAATGNRNLQMVALARCSAVMRSESKAVKSQGKPRPTTLSPEPGDQTNKKSTANWPLILADFCNHYYCDSMFNLISNQLVRYYDGAPRLSSTNVGEHRDSLISPPSSFRQRTIILVTMLWGFSLGCLPSTSFVPPRVWSNNSNGNVTRVL